ncbi:hypothetical protein FOBRF1_007184 [Fusarium oxysporum]
MAETNEPLTATSAPSIVADPAAGPTDQIAIDPHFHDSDGDSALGDDRTVSTASISSTILQYRKLHGRTYHNFKTAEYWYQHRRFPGAVIIS